MPERATAGPVEVLVRTEEPEDRLAVRALLAAAFGRADEADLVDRLRQDEAWLPGLALVAVHGSRVVGHVVLTRMSVGAGEALALAPLAVAPQCQRRGIGQALVGEALRRAADAGERVVVVLGDPAYYRRFGFRPAAGLGVTGPFAEPGDAFQVLALGADPPPAGQARYAPAFELRQA